MKSNTPSWSEITRLEFIERLLYWRGWINRSDLVDQFGLSLPQATNDLVTYSTLSEGGCAYNIRRRRYETTTVFEPRLTLPRLWDDLTELAPVAWSQEASPLLAAPEVPSRAAPMEVCQQISRAIFSQQAVKIRYLSGHARAAELRKISPRALANDGLRVHVRAYCHRVGEFRDFNLSRIKEIAGCEPCQFSGVVDEDWQNFVELCLSVNPELTPEKQAALQYDYGMTKGRLLFRARKALFLYTARRLGFILAGKQEPPYANELGELILERVTEVKAS